jgi:hypothetical protein
VTRNAQTGRQVPQDYKPHKHMLGPNQHTHRCWMTHLTFRDTPGSRGRARYTGSCCVIKLSLIGVTTSASFANFRNFPSLCSNQVMETRKSCQAIIQQLLRFIMSLTASVCDLWDHPATHSDQTSTTAVIRHPWSTPVSQQDNS